MKRGLAPILALLPACSGACDRPDSIVEEVMAAIGSGDWPALEARVHEGYADPLGGRAVLLEELRALHRDAGPIEVRVSELEILPGATPACPVEVIGKVQAELKSAPSWRFLAPLRIELSRPGKLRVQSGLLDDLRGIRRLFAERREAIEANDAEAYGDLLHPQYRDGDADREQTVERLRRDLAGVPIRLRPLSYWAEVRGLDAHVDERYEITAKERTVAAIGRFTLRRSAGQWRILSGLYRSEP